MKNTHNPCHNLWMPANKPLIIRILCLLVYMYPI
uniref:Uncharacterized protein n=1 Tax=Anguilla anguilla TaxID=7936 RepID=A0A0E9RYB8_ANGAN